MCLFLLLCNKNDMILPWQPQTNIRLIHFFEMVLENSVVRILNDLDNYL